MKVSGSLVKNCYMSFLVANAATTATHSALVLETKAVDPGPLDSLITRFFIPEWYYDLKCVCNNGN